MAGSLGLRVNSHAGTGYLGQITEGFDRMSFRVEREKGKLVRAYQIRDQHTEKMLRAELRGHRVGRAIWLMHWIEDPSGAWRIWKAGDAAEVFEGGTKNGKR